MFYSKMGRKLTLMLAFFALIACQKSSDSLSIKPTNIQPAAEAPKDVPLAQGFINGSDWSFKSGRALLKKSMGVEYYEILLWGEVVADPCNLIVEPGFEVRLFMTKKIQESSLEGRDPFSKYPLMIFFDNTMSVAALVADKGTISIDSFTETTVSGLVHGSFPTGSFARTEVSGSFQVGICTP